MISLQRLLPKGLPNITAVLSRNQNLKFKPEYNEITQCNGTSFCDRTCTQDNMEESTESDTDPKTTP